jgi:DGQHR domain-containing protein
MVFLKGEDIGESTFGHLHLPTVFASAWIIDGQHRLYGYAYSKRAEKDVEDKTYFPVLAYINLASTEEAQMFIDINCEQVKVSRNLLNEIYANLKLDSNIFREQLEGICSRASMMLNSLTVSPIFGRLLTTNQWKTNIRCLTLNSFVDGLKENKFFGEERKSGVIPGPLTASYSTDIYVTLDKAIQVINYYLSLFKNELTDHWNLGDDPGGFLCTNNGIRVLLRVLNEILLHIEYESSSKIHSLKPEDLFENIKKYAWPIIDSFKTYTPLEIDILRSRIALKGVNLNTMNFLSIINRTFPGFHPDKLARYLETVDEEGTKDARNLIEEIQLRIYNFIVSKLKERFPGDKKGWWREGVPESVRVECSVKCEKEKGIKEPHQYLGLIDYVDILSINWVNFEKDFTIRKGAGKKESLESLKKLNSIRNITHHPEKWPADKSDVKFVREYHAHIINKLV